MAQIFVSAPFFINSARVGLEQIDEEYELAAYTMGASRWDAFWYIVLPLVRPALLTGIGLAWARSAGELGATITFAGNLPGITQTLSIAVYLAAQDDLDTAVALSVLLLAVSFGVPLVVQLGRRKQGVGAETRGG
jgi:molybdate transport system permease protein